MTLTNTAREAAISLRRERVAQLVIRQLTVREIAEALARGDKDGNNRIVNPKTGEPYSHVTIISDIEALKAEWSEKRSVNMDEHAARQLAEMSEVKRAGWAAKEPELVRRTLRDEMDLLGTKKAQELNINVNIMITVELLIKAIEARGESAADYFEETLREFQLADSQRDTPAG